MKSKWKRNGKNEIGKFFYSYAYYLLRGKKNVFYCKKPKFFPYLPSLGQNKVQWKHDLNSHECLLSV